LGLHAGAGMPVSLSSRQLLRAHQRRIRRDDFNQWVCHKPVISILGLEASLRYERPPPVSNHANIGQDLLSLFFGPFGPLVR
jgi:hypothetical protein